MRLHRLRVQNFAAIREMEIAFGPGLNVLYGPNDLGKSTLAEAIRLALLLPYTSTHCDPYISWSGADDPFVELTFETEEQRIWRVRKQFGKRGSALLQESRNGQDFDDVERARGGDGRLREILRWGIPEPGGAGAGKGLPTSFLATALLSTQEDVTNVLQGSLQDDSTATGKDQIAAALQAAAQDPLFVALLRETQARRDEAYTDKGARKTARGSVFKAAAERLKLAREERDRLQKIVDDSNGVERQREDLVAERDRCELAHAAAEERLAALERLARQSTDRTAAEEVVRAAREMVLRIQRMDREVAEAERSVAALAGVKAAAEEALRDLQVIEMATGAALAAAEEAARAAGLDSDMADTVARQALELRRAAAEQAVQGARQNLAAVAGARELAAAAGRAEEESRRQEAEAARARELWAAAAQAGEAADEALRRCDLLARAAEAQALEKQVASARADVEKESALQAEWTKVSQERTAAADQRASILVPPEGSLAALRRLETERAGARGALNVGLVLTVIPTAIVNLRVRRDGVASDPGIVSQPLEVEADTEVEVEVADLATVRVRGGRREAQETVRVLENRWESEVLPHLTAAGVADLEALEAKMAEARELDSRIQRLDVNLESLTLQLKNLAGAADVHREVSARATERRLELGDVPFETLAAELAAFGPDPAAALRTRRQQATRDAEAARTALQGAATAQTLAEERARSARVGLDAAVPPRDAALAGLPAGLEAAEAAAEAAAQSALRVASEQQETITAELALLQERVDVRQGQLQNALTDAQAAVEQAGRAVEAAQEDRALAIANHATEEGRLAEIRRLREAEDLAAAERGWSEATERYEALPVPERLVSPEEVTAARDALAQVTRGIESLDRELHIIQGRLQQVGGAVARGQLGDAEEAYELAARHDREIEADYEAWRLLLDQMKEADAAQASNLGQALVPVIATRFQELTRQRYQSVQLTAHLGTEGVVVAGTVRPADRISVGTREQLSTLYRLCLGEYLRTTVVLDDQLVQSDDTRMEWFRALLAEKARGFQIVVFTCRPGDYLAREEMVGEDGVVHADSGEGFVRAVDLGRAVGG